MKLKLKNLDASEKALDVSLLLPKELSADALERRVTLAPAGETVLSYKIRRFSALPGSVYPVFALLRLEAGGIHSFASTMSTVSVVEGAKGASRSIAAACALAAAAAWALWTWLRR